MNSFNDLLFELLDLLEDAYNEYGDLYIEHYPKILLRLFARKHLANPDRFKKWKDEYYSSIDSFRNNNFDTIDSWVKNIYSIIGFIRTGEKCFMYINDKDNVIYTDEVDDSKILYFNSERYKCKISFTQTKVDQLSFDTIDDSLEKIFNDSNYLTFVTIEVKRIFGKEMCNTFKFLANSNPQFNDESDAVLFEKVMNNVSKTLVQEIHHIFSMMIYQMMVWEDRLHSNFVEYNHISWFTGFLEYGLYYKK